MTDWIKKLQKNCIFLIFGLNSKKCSSVANMPDSSGIKAFFAADLDEKSQKFKVALNVFQHGLRVWLIAQSIKMLKFCVRGGRFHVCSGMSQGLPMVWGPKNRTKLSGGYHGATRNGIRFAKNGSDQPHILSFGKISGCHELWTIQIRILISGNLRFFFILKRVFLHREPYPLFNTNKWSRKVEKWSGWTSIQGLKPPLVGGSSWFWNFWTELTLFLCAPAHKKLKFHVVMREFYLGMRELDVLMREF